MKIACGFLIVTVAYVCVILAVVFSYVCVTRTSYLALSAHTFTTQDLMRDTPYDMRENVLCGYIVDGRMDSWSQTTNNHCDTLQHEAIDATWDNTIVVMMQENHQ